MPTDAVGLVVESFALAALRHPWPLGHWGRVINRICPQLNYDGEDMEYYSHSGAMVHQTLLYV